MCPEAARVKNQPTLLWTSKNLNYRRTEQTRRHSRQFVCLRLGTWCQSRPF